MIRSTLLYRKAWYIRRRNLQKISLCMRLGMILLVLLVCYGFFCSRLQPILREEVEKDVASVTEAAVDDAVDSVFARYEGSDKIYALRKDSAGGAEAVSLNIAEINKILNDVSGLIESSLSGQENRTLEIPIGNITGTAILYGKGPVLRLNIVTRSHVDANYDQSLQGGSKNLSGFEAVVRIHVSVSYQVLTIKKGMEVSRSIPLAAGFLYQARA